MQKSQKNVIFLEAVKKENNFKERKHFEMEKNRIRLWELRETLADIVERRLIDERNLMGATWILYQISIHNRAEGILSKAKNNGEINDAIIWLTECEKRILKERCSEASPTIPEIIYECDSQSEIDVACEKEFSRQGTGDNSLWS